MGVFTTLSTGTVGRTAIFIFIGMYLLYVGIVLVADVYHRSVVLPRIREVQFRRQKEQEGSTGDSNVYASNKNQEENLDGTDTLNRVMGALSNYDGAGETHN